jgi:hypothetical protein
MDATEKHVLDHLKHRGYETIIYEPDGNIPPDFLVDGCIAIEVRRLNQNQFEGGSAKGFEEVAIPLWNRIKELVDSFDAPIDDESWIVFFRFTRPVEPWKSLGPKLRQALEMFRDSAVKRRGTIIKTQGFELEVSKADYPHATLFAMGGYNDAESDGWSLSEMEANIRHCVTEKSRKIARVRAKYEQWWLALVDLISDGQDDVELKMFRDQVCIEHDWDKIILIDPQDYTRWFEI